MKQNVKVIHGANDDTFECVFGCAVASVRASLVEAFNIPATAVTLVNGSLASAAYRLRAGDILEFVVPWGRKSGLPVNEYGNIVTTDGVPAGLAHVDLPRLGPTCKRLGIEYAKAVVGWTDYGPVISGVVIRAEDLRVLENALAAKSAKRRRQADDLPILAALFTLNRRAKRCRDLAHTYYEARMHGLAGSMRREKERIYFLKGQILHHLVESGHLVGGRFHRFQGGVWAEVLDGSGYTFHRPCPPQAEGTVAESLNSIEAKPKGAKEPSLEVASQAVEQFLAGKPIVRIYQWPPKQRVPRGWRWEEEDDWLEDDDEGF